MMRLITITIACLVAALSLAALAAQPGSEGFDLRDFVESKYAVLLDTDSSVAQVKPGGEFTLALRLSPYEGLHIYGVEQTDNLSVISSALTLDEIPGIEWGEPKWPAGTLHETQIGDAYWLVGQPVVLIPGKVAVDAAPGPLTLTAKVLFSSCSEEFCLAPSEVPVEWKFEVVPADYAGEIAAKTNDELLAPVTIDQSRYQVPEPESEVGGGLDLSGGEEDGAETSAGASGGGVDLGNLNIEKSTSFPLWKIILLALLGGLVLNIMPCVLPVVSIKVIDLVSAMEKKGSETVKHGLLFALGIIATFLAGAVVIAVIQALGTKLNWGFQFQNPTFVLVMAIIIFVFALSLADMFKIKAPSAALESGGTLAKDEGAAGSFFKGVLATVLGTPCVGPFLGPALAVAFTMTWVHTILIFLFVGVGMALPYFLMLPFLGKMSKRDRGRLSRKLQEGKSWMDHFKHAMSFLLFATVIYLLYIMQGVLGGVAIIWVLLTLLGVAVAAWLWGTLIHLKQNPYLWAAVSAILVLALTGWFCVPRVYAQTGGGSKALSAETHAGWEQFELAKLKEYTSEGRTVLVDFTADWCPNCKTNEAVALNIDSTMKLKDELGITFMVADFTQRDAEIGDTLRALGFTSVPLTAIFPGSDPNKPILLDGLFSPSRLQDALRDAAGGGLELSE
jgi:thiol:disulfide interchange protein